ncbi:hypothetical protein AB1Y20_007163 [Prymnesium parvum]|uniref:Receptor ligand binding region domain-containing protein n=1 Tax=Prymnesium parvum TaxID=97485 RepID=A0AB34ITN2_PRYPA
MPPPPPAAPPPPLHLGFFWSGDPTRGRPAAHALSAALHSLHASPRLSFAIVNASPRAALRGARELEAARVDAVLGGGGSSNEALISALSLSLAAVPQLGFGATAPALASRALYPYYSRVVPSDVWQARALAALCASLGWAYVAVVRTADAYAAGAAAAFEKAHAAAGGRVVRALQLPADAAAPPPLDELYASHARVVLLFIGTVGERMLSSSTPRLHFLGADTWIDDLLVDGGSAPLLTAAAGALGTRPHVCVSCAAFSSFLSAWRAAPPLAPPPLACDAPCRASPPPWYAAYAFDAALRLLRAWRAPPPFLAAIRAARGAGLANVSLGADGEPRAGAYDVMQWQFAAAAPRLARVAVASGAGRVAFASNGSGLVFPGFAAGVLPSDGRGASATQSYLLAQPAESLPSAHLGSVAVQLRNSFGEAINASDEACGLVELVLSTCAACTEAQASCACVVVKAGDASCCAGALQLAVAQPKLGGAILCALTFLTPAAAGRYFWAVRLRSVVISGTQGSGFVVVSGEHGDNLLAVLPATLAANLILALCCGWALLYRRRARASRLLRLDGNGGDDPQRDLLALFSNPQMAGLRPLSLGQDMKHLMRSLPLWRIAIEPAASLVDAQEALRRYRPRVVIFSGHTFMGVLAFENDVGKLDLIQSDHSDATLFSRLLLGQVPLSVEPAKESQRSSRGSRRGDDSSCSPIRRLKTLTGGKPFTRRNPIEESPDASPIDTALHAARVEGGAVGLLHPRRSFSENAPRVEDDGDLDVVAREVLDRLQCVMLNGCKTEAIALHLLHTSPKLRIVCWKTLAEDNAARAFSAGFYSSLAAQLERERRARYEWRWWRAASSDRLSIDEAFEAGCDAFRSQGFVFGDPEEHLHPPGHAHHYRPDFINCPHCTPPVHGETLLLGMGEGGVTTLLGSNRESVRERGHSLVNSVSGLMETFTSSLRPRSGSRLCRVRSFSGQPAKAVVTPRLQTASSAIT